MSTSAAPPHAAGPAIDPALSLGCAQLAVADLERSVDFYTRVLGLEPISSDGDGAQLGFGGERPSLALSRLEHAVSAPPQRTGLFHLAWLHPSRRDLAATLERVLRARWPVHGASDHGVSEALYLSDPDGLGVEIYADRARERWRRPADGQGVEMVTQPLDVDDLLAQAPLEPLPRISPGGALGHVHLKVADVARSVTFYRDTLGFDVQAEMPSAAFLSAGGYHHHIAVNAWQSRGAGAPAQNAPGVRLVTFELSSAEAVDALAHRLRAAPQPPAGLHERPGRLELSDPDAIRLAFTARAA
jgi:catechol 2,3-dioxygenase